MSSNREVLNDLKAQSLFRELRTFDTTDGATIRYGDRSLINFASNDYLGLSQHPRICEAAKEAIDRYGLGAGASRLITGSRGAHERCEAALAAFKAAEAAILFGSGYAAAVGTIGSLVGQKDVVIIDKLAHASLIDGARLSGSMIRVFPHNNLKKLDDHLIWAARKHPLSRRLVITESVFSMDGDVCDLHRIVALKKEHRALLLLDEAHATGVIGPSGRGLAALLGLEQEVDIQMGTLSKALGVCGGFIAGAQDLIHLLTNRARSFVYSTAPPPAIAAAAEAAIQILQTSEGESLIGALRRNIRTIIAQLPPRFFTDFSSAIIPLQTGGEQLALELANQFLEAGLLIPAIRYPTVAKGAARLRLTVSAAQTEDQIQKLINILHATDSIR
jgi:8-amino-7-oxononanoate synthase